MRCEWVEYGSLDHKRFMGQVSQWKHPHGSLAVTALHDKAHSQIAVKIDGEGVVAVANMCQFHGWYRILNLVTHPNALRQGHGTTLWEFMDPGKCWLTSEPQSILFWESCGFKPIGVAEKLTLMLHE